MANVATHITYCRICPAHCGLEVTVEDDVVTKVAGDTANPVTRGFTCAKGRRIGDFHADPNRLRQTLRRQSDGRFAPIEIHDAIAEIAGALDDIRTEHGPDSIGVFVGTQTYTASLTHSFLSAWFRAVGSSKKFTTVTIDQSAKIVTTGRLGTWLGGRQRFQDADTWMLVGTNPLVSMQGGDMTGFPVHDNLRALQEARRNGMRLIVVDPRRTEAAANADIHLQLRPGTDAALLAAIHHVLLRDDLADAAFCDRWADGIPELREAVAPFTPTVAAEICDVDEALLVEAAHVFGQARSGMATSGTGPDMGPHANVAEHLVQALNVVCGRFPRAGDRPGGWNVLSRNPSYRAQARAPRRPWERAPRNRFGQSWLRSELMSPALPDEIQLDGPDRIRALVVAGGNPGAAFPDQDRILSALADLELLVVLDPYLTETARQAHYVIAPTMSLERAEDTKGYGHFNDVPFAQFTDAVLEAPEGAIHDWEFFLRLGQAMGLTLEMGKLRFGPDDPVPTDVEVLAARGSSRTIAADELRAHPHGVVVDDADPPVVGPAADDADDRFAVFPDDVADELRHAYARLSSPDDSGSLRLVVGRTKETMNSLGRRLPGLARFGHNPCHTHPDDLAAAGVSSGDVIELTSAHGSVRAVARADASLRPGTVWMTHCFGGEPGAEDDARIYGTNPARLLSLDVDAQSISLMPLMTAIPVTMTAVAG